MWQTLSDKLKVSGHKSVAYLVDPDKFDPSPIFFEKLKKYSPTYILVGGSSDITTEHFDDTVATIKQSCDKPVYIFPGSTS